MNRKYIYLLFAFVSFNVIKSKAQVYVAKVSNDSLNILNGRVNALKVSQKIQELKLQQFNEEAQVEKLREKLLDANDKAKNAAEKNTKHSKRLGEGTVDSKETEKVAKKARNAMQESQKALDRYNKQIKVVEELRETIQAEEQKAVLKKPVVVFSY